MYHWGRSGTFPVKKRRRLEVKAYLVKAGTVKHLLCGDCVKQMVADILGELTAFTVNEVSSDNLAFVEFPWCDACDASFAGSVEKVEVSQ